MRRRFAIAVGLAIAIASAAADDNPVSRITAAGLLADTRAHLIGEHANFHVGNSNAGQAGDLECDSRDSG